MFSYTVTTPLHLHSVLMISCKPFSYSLYKLFLMYFGQERPMILAHPFGMHQTIRLLCPTSHFSLAIDQDAIIVLIGALFVKFFFSLT